MNIAKQYDLVLIGGGVIGLSIAYQCALKGWSVCVLESGEIGKGASWAGAGILPSGATIPALDPLEQLRALSHRLHPIWSDELRESTGIDNEFRRCGGLYFAITKAEIATLLANHAWWDEHGIRYERCSAVKFQLDNPGLRHLADAYQEAGCWWLPDDCRLRNPRHIQALEARLKGLKVDLFSRTSVQDFQVVAGHVVHALCDGDVSIAGDRFCVASGAWAAKLLSKAGTSTGIMPVRGQIVLYKTPSPLFSCVLNDGHRYLVPRDDGHVLAGSCEEEVGFVVETTKEKLRELDDWAKNLLPILAEAQTVKSWAGLRPGSFDSYPYLGKVTGLENLYVAAGHFRHGLHWSTGTGVLMQQLMFGEETSIDLEPFRVIRGNATAIG